MLEGNGRIDFLGCYAAGRLYRILPEIEKSSFQKLKKTWKWFCYSSTKKLYKYTLQIIKPSKSYIKSTKGISWTKEICCAARWSRKEKRTNKLEKPLFYWTNEFSKGYWNTFGFFKQLISEQTGRGGLI